MNERYTLFKNGFIKEKLDLCWVYYYYYLRTNQRQTLFKKLCCGRNSNRCIPRHKIIPLKSAFEGIAELKQDRNSKVREQEK